MAAVRILVCASEAPRPPLNGSRLVLRELCERLAARHEITVLALRHPDQSGPPPAGVTMLELPSRRRVRSARGHSERSRSR